MDPFRYEEKHREEERKFWKTYIRLSILTLVISTVGFGFAYEALRSGQEQARAAMSQLRVMEQAQRPWLEITSVKPMFLIGAGTMMSGEVRVRYKNIGQTPARDPRFYGKFFPGYADTYQIKANICRRAHGLWGAQKENILFPKKSGGGRFRVTQSWTKLVDAASTMPIVINVFIGCLTYEYSGSQRVHSTVYTAVLGRKKRSPTESPGFDLWKTLSLKPDKNVTFTTSKGEKWAN